MKYENIRHLVDGRFIADHTARKGFWIEDFETGRKYYLSKNIHIYGIVRLLNSFNEGNKRYVYYYREKYGRIIEDTLTGEKYNLGDSKHISDITRLLNEWDYQYNGKRTFAHRRLLM